MKGNIEELVDCIEKMVWQDIGKFPMKSGFVWYELLRKYRPSSAESLRIKYERWESGHEPAYLFN